MSVTTIYKCDKCGAETQSREQFWEVAVTLRSISSNDAVPRNKQHWCRMCVEAAGILPPVAHEQAKERVLPSPTFEDLVRSIVAEMTGAA